MTLSPGAAFADLPTGLRDDLVDAYNDVVRNYAERRWGPSELDGGKLCEAVYTVIRGMADGTMAARASKPRDMVGACRNMEQETAQSRSVRIQIPRMILGLYEIRNNRGVGHAGGDVDPNEMDATAVLYMSKWLLAELVRVRHTLTTLEAEELVESLVERQVPVVWTGEDKKRVLRPGLTWKQNTLLLLLSETGAVAEADLYGWLEHPSKKNFRSAVLRPGHKARLWEYNEDRRTVALLPPGVEAGEALARTLS